MKKYNINEQNLDTDLGVSGLTTMLRLINIYQNEVQGRQFKGKDGKIINPYDAVLYKWMGRDKTLKTDPTPENNKYIKNVRQFMNDFTLESGTMEYED